MTTNSRDDLATLIHDWLYSPDSANSLGSALGMGDWENGDVQVDGDLSPTKLADAIVAAGWRPPAVVRTASTSDASAGAGNSGRPPRDVQERRQ